MSCKIKNSGAHRTIVSLSPFRLRECSLSEASCASLRSALRSSPSHLKELELSYNRLHDSGVELLCNFLEIPECQLERLRSGAPYDTSNLFPPTNSRSYAFNVFSSLRLRGCSLSRDSCTSLVSTLKSKSSLHLREVVLSYNNLQESDVMMLEEVKYKEMDELNSPILDDVFIDPTDG